jgi:hypothetical protein
VILKQHSKSYFSRKPRFLVDIVKSLVAGGEKITITYHNVDFEEPHEILSSLLGEGHIIPQIIDS